MHKYQSNSPNDINTEWQLIENNYNEKRIDK